MALVKRARVGAFAGRYRRIRDLLQPLNAWVASILTMMPLLSEP